MSKLWKKTSTKLHPDVEAYTAGTDHIFDMHILPYDIAASRVHAQGLQKAGVLTKKERMRIDATLSDILKKFRLGEITITTADEDCHTVIENHLVRALGPTGKKIHTGRSRNDQVAVAMRLYMKDHLHMIREGVIDLSKIFIEKAKAHAEMPMPGYSHTQQAMLGSVGHYFASFAESLLDDADYLAYTVKYIDKCPLGSAAGFGTSIQIDREFTARALGFASVQVNTLYCQTSRGKFESAYMEALAQLMLTLGRFANDMVLFTSQEFDYFSVDDSLVTGSSIMPHKRNLDVLELVRGNVSVVIGNQLMVKDVTKNLISGYNRDGQLIKKPLIESTDIVVKSLEVVSLVLTRLTAKPESIIAKINPAIFTADYANQLVMEKGIPFRDAYKEAARVVPAPVDFEANIRSKKSLGAPGNLSLDSYRRRGTTSI